MASTLDGIAFASQFLSLLGFLGTCVVLFRYLDPWNEYLILTNLVFRIRKMWDRYERKDLLPNDNSKLLFLKKIEGLEKQVMDLIYVTRTSIFRPHLRAWACAFHLKGLVKNARLLHVALLMISEYQRRIKEARRSVSPKNVQEMEGRVKLISLEFNRLTGTPFPPLGQSRSQETSQSRRRTSTDSDITLVSQASSSQSVRGREFCLGFIAKSVTQGSGRGDEHGWALSSMLKQLLFSRFRPRTLRKKRSTHTLPL